MKICSWRYLFSIHFTEEINSTNDFNYTNYNLTSRYLIFNLDNGNYTITVRPGMYVSNYEHEYFGEWFSLDFEIFLEPTTFSTTLSTTLSSTPTSTPTTTSSYINHGDNGGRSTSDILLVVAIVIASIVLFLGIIVLYDRYSKSNNMILIWEETKHPKNPALA